LEIEGESKAGNLEADFRKYKVYITYDEYYHTPRLWISGNDINGAPLSSKQVFEDVYAEYRNETVTEDTMPQLGIRMLTIHPCNHSKVMKTFVDGANAKSKTRKIKPHMALIIFLKFMSSVMPTIQYDQTLDIEI
jgi:ubiquitin-like-conjugating enzyme ATG3